MRIFPILTAIVVVAVLFLFVFERDRLLELANGAPEAAATESAATAPVAKTDEAPGERAVPVVAMRSEASTVDGAVVLRGRTEAVRQVDVRAETAGRIVSTPLRKGAFVEEGELLCRLDTGTREAALAEAQSRLTQAQAALREAEINRTAATRLSEGGFASETRVASSEAAAEAARASIQSAEASIAAAQDEIGKLEIRAPFGGVLESDSAELGSLLQPGSLCATIIQLDPIRVVGFVPEAMVDRVELDAFAGARLTSGREIVGLVTFISRSADQNTRTFRVDVEVPNTDLSIRDGQTAEIAIQSEGEVAHLLPQSALTLDDDGKLGVRVVADARAAFAPVSVLRDTTNGVWVSGLAATTEVIVVGQEFVTDGVPVKVTYRETSE